MPLPASSGPCFRLRLIFPCLLFCAAAAAAEFKPVIMKHGVGSDHHEMDTILRLLNATHPGTIATSLPLFGGKPDSWDHDLNTQVAGVAAAIRKLVAADPAAYAGGYHLVCKSQGALICRCVVEEMDDHNVDTFVSLAGPQVGVYGTAYFEAMRSWGLPEWLIKGTVDLMGSWRTIRSAKKSAWRTCGATQSTWTPSTSMMFFYPNTRAQPRLG